MGFLHEGHTSLIERAKKENDRVVVSVFVNPTQFAPNEDLDKYPRDIRRDTIRAEKSGCDILFTPTVPELYPDGFSTYVTVEGLSSVLEGQFRPSHFKGVTTIVLKLFNLIQPTVSYFGQKDAQQSIVIKRMVKDLNIPVKIEIVPTVREADGLALSSRNVYLNPEQRLHAVVLRRSLVHAETAIADGERNSKKITDEMISMISTAPISHIDYVEIVDAETLIQKEHLHSGDRILIPVAVRFGSTRLIDNTIVTV